MKRPLRARNSGLAWFTVAILLPKRLYLGIAVRTYHP